MLTDEQIDSADMQSLSWMAPRGKDSVREFARAIESAATAPLLAEIERLKADSERLSWMIFFSAKVIHGNDGEYCCVVWRDEDGEYQTKLYGSANEAIDAAIYQQEHQ